MSISNIPVERPQLLIGTMERTIQKHLRGRVRVNGVSWFAAYHAPAHDRRLKVGDKVKICARQGNTFLVCPLTEQVFN
ncbi:MAG: hypothetical protein F6J87_16035 [Spirulina sp. SIO3F2]|nr:hypothetical protein [Spirulina sp. SIO3F2]